MFSGFHLIEQNLIIQIFFNNAYGGDTLKLNAQISKKKANEASSKV